MVLNISTKPPLRSEQPSTVDVGKDLKLPRSKRDDRMLLVDKESGPGPGGMLQREGEKDKKDGGAVPKPGVDPKAAAGEKVKATFFQDYFIETLKFDVESDHLIGDRLFGKNKTRDLQKECKKAWDKLHEAMSKADIPRFKQLDKSLADVMKVLDAGVLLSDSKQIEGIEESISKHLGIPRDQVKLPKVIDALILKHYVTDKKLEIYASKAVQHNIEVATAMGWLGTKGGALELHKDIPADLKKALDLMPVDTLKQKRDLAFGTYGTGSGAIIAVRNAWENSEVVKLGSQLKPVFEASYTWQTTHTDWMSKMSSVRTAFQAGGVKFLKETPGFAEGNAAYGKKVDEAYKKANDELRKLGLPAISKTELEEFQKKAFVGAVQVTR